MNPYHPQPIVVPSEAGKVLKFLGVTHKLTYQQTGGTYYLFEFEFEPESGNRLHVHQHEDEVVHVLEGAIEIRLGDQKLQMGLNGWSSQVKGNCGRRDSRLFISQTNGQSRTDLQRSLRSLRHGRQGDDKVINANVIAIQ